MDKLFLLEVKKIYIYIYTCRGISMDDIIFLADVYIFW